MRHLMRLMRLTDLFRSPPAGGPLTTTPVEYRTTDGTYYQTADGHYYGIGA
ncbi:hypothetical protein [Thiocystis violacea]|uniref:hypothetical protein n=1 Tax=Thiocystis violacea TaxID=13725 RepID=UPI001907FFB0|nr:hypothetical protein [Thiocystis violacea]